MKCAKCFKELTEDQDRSNLLMDLENDNVESYKKLFQDENLGLHENCAKEVIKEEKFHQYLKTMAPFFKKLNRSQIRDCDTEAIVSAFFNQHRYLQNEAIIVLKAIIDRIGAKAGDPGYTDPRNQWALDWCKKASNV